ncbi:hypothetical protein [Streptomyces sp. G-G2]|uniref:hypothetical protein n=1 Tax=Streptomyces sp. G-G2 TaxID=3046201 RepID=UPI0024B8CF36|nr:hypothetical protein [Streptomyces sp. G-G2]MDJ0385684.1 hypothetical protein [Streptomyces sp. G-G2]
MTERGEAMRGLCALVAAYEHERAGELVAAGADPDRVLPDGTTPLLRAVEGGSPGVVTALLGADRRARLPEAERARLLAAARRWYEAGAGAELRWLTGAEGAAERRVVEEDYADVEEVVLGGRTVRAGHGVVLTGLEREFAVPTPVGELMDRAVPRPDQTIGPFACERVLRTNPGSGRFPGPMFDLAPGMDRF